MVLRAVTQPLLGGIVGLNRQSQSICLAFFPGRRQLQQQPRAHGPFKAGPAHSMNPIRQGLIQTRAYSCAPDFRRHQANRFRASGCVVSMLSTASSRLTPHRSTAACSRRPPDQPAHRDPVAAHAWAWADSTSGNMPITSTSATCVLMTCMPSGHW
ncbi:MAG: hypothetical protein ACJAWL_001704 [Motiliproteus sp.]|jgi:hypothetical protein